MRPAHMCPPFSPIVSDGFNDFLFHPIDRFLKISHFIVTNIALAREKEKINGTRDKTKNQESIEQRERLERNKDD